MAIIRRADRLAQDYTEEAIDKLVEIMRTGEDKYAISAASSLLDRGHGKPLVATISLPSNQEQARMLAGMTDAELDDAILVYDMPRQLAAPKDPLLG